MTPLEPTMLSVTLNAAGIVPSANKRFPSPNVIGSLIRQKLSTRSCFISVWSSLPLPQMCRSGPSPFLSSATFFATSPFKNTEGCHVEKVMVFDATYLVAVLTRGQMSPCCGQNAAQISKVLRPNKRSIGISNIFFTAAPIASSSKGAHHPPYAKPLLVSSSGPPPACMTPSRVMCSSTVILLMITFLQVSSDLVEGECNFQSATTE